MNNLDQEERKMAIDALKIMAKENNKVEEKHITTINKFRIKSPFYELPNNVLWSHYENEYGYLIVKDKVILDIGADVGTSADYFLQQGAKKIYAIEGEDYHYQPLLKNIIKQGWQEVVIPEQMMVCSADNFKTLIEKYPADIVKIDCEGCERFWLELDDNIVSIPDVYIIEFHTPLLSKQGVNKLLNLGYKIENRIDVNWVTCVILFSKGDTVNATRTCYKTVFKDPCH